MLYLQLTVSKNHHRFINIKNLGWQEPPDGALIESVLKWALANSKTLQYFILLCGRNVLRFPTSATRLFSARVPGGYTMPRENKSKRFYFFWIEKTTMNNSSLARSIILKFAENWKCWFSEILSRRRFWQRCSRLHSQIAHCKKYLVLCSAWEWGVEKFGIWPDDVCHKWKNFRLWVGVLVKHILPRNRKT